MRRITLFLWMTMIAAGAMTQEATPPQELNPEVERILRGGAVPPADTLTLVPEAQSQAESAKAAPESTRKTERVETTKPGFAEKARQGVTALKVMGRVGSGLIKDLMEDLFRAP